MEKLDFQTPVSPRCVTCDEQPNFTTSMLDPRTGLKVHMFECGCGKRNWTSDKAL
jgi:hypothetical protein